MEDDESKKGYCFVFGEITMFFFEDMSILMEHSFVFPILIPTVNIDKEVVKAMDFNKDGEPNGIVKNGHNFKPPL
jgi:hypothetical protein